MSRGQLQVKLLVGVDPAPGFDPAMQIAGDNGSNLEFISRETGADVTVRGRNSRFIEPRTGRESSDPLHVFIQHEFDHGAMERACKLVKDLIETVKEDRMKLKQAYQKNFNSKGELGVSQGTREAINPSMNLNVTSGRNPKVGETKQKRKKLSGAAKRKLASMRRDIYGPNKSGITPIRKRDETLPTKFVDTFKSGPSLVGKSDEPLNSTFLVDNFRNKEGDNKTCQQQISVTSSSLMNISDPLKLTKEELSKLDRNQLLEISKMQQALLIKLSNHPASCPEISRASSSTCSFMSQTPELLPTLPSVQVPSTVNTFPPVPPPPSFFSFQITPSSIISPVPSPYLPSKVNDQSNNGGTTINNSGNLFSTEQRNLSLSQTNYSFQGQNYFASHNNFCLSQQIHTSPQTNFTPSPSNYSPQTGNIPPPARNQEERLERYSSQGDNNELFQRRSSSSGTNRSEHQPLYRFKLAIVDRELERLGHSDGYEIKQLIERQRQSAGVRYSIEYDGLTLNNRVFTVIPSTSEAMYWLLDDVKNLNGVGKFYVIFPYDEISKVYRFKIRFSPGINGYRHPKPEDVFNKFEYLNPGVKTDLWKAIESEEMRDQSLNLIISVDYLSYLKLRQNNWQLNYGNSKMKFHLL